MKPLSAMMGVAIAIALLPLLAGCRAAKAAPSDSPATIVIRDTVAKTAYVRDTLCIRDSVHVEGNAVYKERTIYRSAARADTLYITRTDTVPVVRTLRVEATLTPWQRFRLKCFPALLAALAASAAWRLRKPIAKLISRCIGM